MFSFFRKLKESLYFQHIQEIKSLKQSNKKLSEDIRILKRGIIHRDILLQNSHKSKREVIQEKLKKEREMTVHKNRLNEFQLKLEDLTKLQEHKGCSIQYDTRNISCVNRDYEIQFTCTVQPAVRAQLEEKYGRHLPFHLSSPNGIRA